MVLATPSNKEQAVVPHSSVKSAQPQPKRSLIRQLTKTDTESSTTTYDYSEIKSPSVVLLKKYAQVNEDDNSEGVGDEIESFQVFWDGTFEMFKLITAAGEIHEQVECEANWQTGFMKAKFAPFGWQDTSMSFVEWQQCTNTKTRKTVSKRPSGPPPPQGTPNGPQKNNGSKQQSKTCVFKNLPSIRGQTHGR